ncbi:MAG: hypothetical protein ACI32N_04730 [Bulleidia sp.]
MKKLLLKCLSMVLCVTAFAVPVFAEEPEETPQSGCAVSMNPVPEVGEVILLEDLSDPETITPRGAAPVTRNVSKTYSIRIQDSSGSCVNSATVSVTGNYSYDASTGEILSTNITAAVTNAPTLWTVGISSQWTTISGTSISHSIYYYSRVDDPYSCMVGGGNWYSGATFQIK